MEVRNIYQCSITYCIFFSLFLFLFLNKSYKTSSTLYSYISLFILPFFFFQSHLISYPKFICILQLSNVTLYFVTTVITTIWLDHFCKWNVLHPLLYFTLFPIPFDFTPQIYVFSNFISNLILYFVMLCEFFFVVTLFLHILVNNNWLEKQGLVGKSSDFFYFYNLFYITGVSFGSKD